MHFGQCANFVLSVRDFDAVHLDILSACPHHFSCVTIPCTLLHYSLPLYSKFRSGTACAFVRLVLFCFLCVTISHQYSLSLNVQPREVISWVSGSPYLEQEYHMSECFARVADPRGMTPRRLTIFCSTKITF